MSNSIHLAGHPYRVPPLHVAPTDSGQMFDLSKIKDGNYFAVVFFLLLDAGTIKEHTIVTDSDQLTANAALQFKLNKDNADIQFSILPEKATPDDITRVNDENQEAAAQREDNQAFSIGARQTGQVTMTRTSTDVNLLQQGTSELTGVIQMTNTIFEVIDKIHGG